MSIIVSGHCGYLLDVTKTVQDVLRRSPKYLARVQSGGFAAWDTSMFSFAAQQYQRESGVRCVRVRVAWIGGGHRGFIWVLPPTMRKRYRSPEENDQLEAFKRLIGMQCEPAIFYTVDQPEPLPLRHNRPLIKEVEEMLWETCYMRFQSGEISVESLVGDITKLTISKVEQT
jgi:hypothetical protein